MKPGRVGIALVAILSCAAARAGAPDVETVVVTGSLLRVASPQANADALTGEDISARDPGTVADLLRMLPGIYVQSAQNGSVGSLFTRGAKPNFTLVLVDGVRVNDPTNTRGGSFDPSTFDLDGVARVEFVRGPASAIYGSDAVGGVINILTDQGTDDARVRLSAQGGSYGFARAAADVAGPLGGARARLGASYADDGSPVDGGSLRTYAFDGALNLPTLAGTEIGLDARYDHSIATSFPDSSGGPQLAVLRALDHRSGGETVLAAHARRDIDADWSMTLEAGFDDRHGQADSPGVAPSVFTPSGIPPNGDLVHFDRTQVRWVNRLTLGPSTELAFGAETIAEHGTDDGYLQFGPFRLPTLFSKSRTTASVFAQARISPLSSLRLEASGRLDAPTGAEGHFSPQARASYAIAPTDTQVSLAFAQGYKLPSFYALGNPIVGDPALKPEDAQNVEADVVQPLRDAASFKLAAYETHYGNLIDFQPGAVPKLVNLSRVRVRGIEASLRVELGALTIAPNFTYTDARNSATGATLRDVPRWLAGGSIRWTITPDVSANFDVAGFGPQTDNSIPTGDVELKTHARADLSLSWQVRANLRLQGTIENLFDARYQDVVGFPAPGITAHAGATLTF